jgi:hypothetical protein
MSNALLPNIPGFPPNVNVTVVPMAICSSVVQGERVQYAEFALPKGGKLKISSDKVDFNKLPQYPFAVSMVFASEYVMYDRNQGVKVVGDLFRFAPLTPNTSPEPTPTPANK